jgi:hypothetical protein
MMHREAMGSEIYFGRMISYHDGKEVRVGDHVDLDGDPAIVFEVLGHEAAAAEGFDEPLVGFRTERHGEIHQSPSDRGWDAIRLTKRHAD